MKFTTLITAIDHNDGLLKHYSGPFIEAISFTDAQNYCDNNGLGYCNVDGILIETIPYVNDQPDWKNKISYENLN